MSPRDLGLGTGIPSFCIFIQFFASDLDFGGGTFLIKSKEFFAKSGSDVPKSEFSLDRSAVPEGHFLHPGGVKFTA